MYRPRRVIGTVIAALVILLLAIVIVGLVVSWPGWFNDTTSPWNVPGVLVSLLITLIILGILARVVLGVIFGPRYGRRYRRWYGYGPWEQDARDMLDQRYARGEITREQYDQMRRDMEREHGEP